MTWIRVEVAPELSGESAAVNYVLDPATGASAKYRCGTYQDANALVTKLNSVDYP